MTTLTTHTRYVPDNPSTILHYTTFLHTYIYIYIYLYIYVYIFIKYIQTRARSIRVLGQRVHGIVSHRGKRQGACHEIV